MQIVASPEEPPSTKSAAPSHRRSIRALATVGYISIASLLAKAVQDLVLAYTMGANYAVDSYAIAFIIVMVAVRIIVSPVISSFLPTYIAALEEGGREPANRLLGELLPMACVAAFVLTGLLALGAPGLLVIGQTTGLSPQTTALSIDMLRIFLLLVPLRAGSQIAAAILNSEHKFAIPTATGALPPLVAIGFMLAATSTLGIYALVLGTMLGETAQLVALIYLALKSTGRIRPHWAGFSPELRVILRQYLPALAGTSISVFNPMVDRAIAAGLGSGSIAHLLYGQKLVGAGLEIAIYAVSSVLLPLFSRQVAMRDWPGVRKSMILYSLLFCGLSLPLVIAAQLLSVDLVHLLLQRGAFHASDTQAVAAVMRMSAYQIPFYLAGTMIARVISAMRATYILAIGAVISFILNIGLDILFARYWGLPGIALSSSAVFLFAFLYLFTAASLMVRNRERAARGAKSAGT